jgi:hypothetical protein
MVVILAAMMLLPSCEPSIGPGRPDELLSRALTVDDETYKARVGRDPIDDIERVQIYCTHDTSLAGYKIEDTKKLPLVYETSERRDIRDIVLYARSSQDDPGSISERVRSIFIVLAFNRDARRIGRFDYTQYVGRRVGVIEWYPAAALFAAPGIGMFFESHNIVCK